MLGALRRGVIEMAIHRRPSMVWVTPGLSASRSSRSVNPGLRNGGGIVDGLLVFEQRLQAEFLKKR